MVVPSGLHGEGKETDSGGKKHYGRKKDAPTEIVAADGERFHSELLQAVWSDRSRGRRLYQEQETRVQRVLVLNYLYVQREAEAVGRWAV